MNHPSLQYRPHITQVVESGDSCVITACCSECDKEKTFTFATLQFYGWLSGVPIQDSLRLPDANDSELMISGICGECFDIMFGDEDDE